jgi:transcriptional regulator with XRE-family HTH domain
MLLLLQTCNSDMNNFTPLRMIREQRGVTLAQVSIATGIDVGKLSRLERGKVSASPEDAAKLAHYFGHAVTELEILYPERYASRGEQTKLAAGDCTQ